MRFEWGQQKHAENIAKHSMTFEEAQSVFDDSLAQIFDDPDHSDAERREIIVGHSHQGRAVLVSFTERSVRDAAVSVRDAAVSVRDAAVSVRDAALVTRIISARLLTPQERRNYANGTFRANG